MVFYILAVALIVLMLFVPVSYCLFTQRIRTSSLTDSRLATMSTILRGISTLKSYAWEQPLLETALRKRDQEYRCVSTLFSV